MAASFDNHGIVGNVTGGNVAVGDNAKIEQNAWQLDISRALVELDRAIKTFQGRADTAVAIQATHEEIVHALAVEPPDKKNIRSKLAVLGQLAGSTTAITQAVMALAEAIGHIL